MKQPTLKGKDTEFVNSPDSAEEASSQAKPQLVMWHYGKIEEMDRSFDVAFWQAQDATARLKAAWELVEFDYTLKGLPKDELRLQRTVGALQRLPG